MKVVISKKHHQTKLEAFQRHFFAFNQTWETAFTENCWIRDFSAAVVLYICIKVLKKDLKFQKRSKNCHLKETGTSNKQRFVYAANLDKRFGKE